MTPLPGAGRRCWNEAHHDGDGPRVNKAAARYCTGCGKRRGATAGQDALVKAAAADPMSRHPRYREWQAETDPGRREMLFQQIYGETCARNPGAVLDFCAKASGFGSAAQMIAAETDPGQRRAYERMANPHLYPEGTPA